MKKMTLKKWIKDEQGAVVVEATIALSAFMFAIVTILTIVNICLVQAKVGIALCQVATDISKISYLYEMTGLQAERESTHAEAADAEEVINNFQSAMTTLSNPSSDITEINESLQSMTDTATTFVEDEDGTMWNSFVALFKGQVYDHVTGYVMSTVCDNLVKSHLGNGEVSGGDYLKALGVVGAGGDETGLDFSESTFCNPSRQETGVSDDIIVVVTYKVHVIKLLGIDIEFNFKQCAATKTWGGAAAGEGASET
ncbi:MAG: hypothetical protein ACI4DO_08370 [Roseburia sp.]